MVDVAAHAARLQAGRCHDPFVVLGRHPLPGGMIIREFMPTASEVEIPGAGAMRRVGDTGVFELRLDSAAAQRLELHYRVRWREQGSDWHEVVSSYSFAPFLYDDDLYLFGEGRHHHAYRFLGCHLARIDDVDGARFAVWAPNAERVSVVGDFNAWNGLRHPMRSRGASGVFELFVPHLAAGDLYKFEIRNAAGIFVKADPYARWMTVRPDTACRVPPAARHQWGDDDWLAQRRTSDWRSLPMSIYEVHVGSWMRAGDGGFLDYRAFADRLVPYVRECGFTHVELLPVMEHPLDESWGYQVSGFYAPTSRYGDPDGLRYLVDACHRAGIGVLLDWVPGHFPRDAFALARFTGEPLYEHPDPRRGEHRDWGTLIFDYGRLEVRNFLLANAVYWCEEFHVDGLRVDAVASMLYLDYSRPPGEWLPNVHGGREHLEAIALLRDVNEVVRERFPGVVTIAEESTAWPGVSRPVVDGGLGFSMKWNMGWMNDTLSYFSLDPVYRRYHHDRLTFNQMYAYTENFVLPLSHDEVVHLKGSLLGKLPGDDWQRFAGLRLLLAWQFATPGKKLLFMGGEFGQREEWSEARALDWECMDDERHLGVKRLVQDLNALYRRTPALHRREFDPEGFAWLDCDDAGHSTLAFTRQADAGHVVCVFNMTPVARDHYRVGIPRAGRYREVVNSDAAWYGGSNRGNLGAVAAEAVPHMGCDHSTTIVLPPLAAVFLEPDAELAQ